MISCQHMISSLLRPVSIGFLALALIGAGCTTGPLGYCAEETPWGSCIDEDGFDDALLGSWRLQSQTVVIPGQPVVVNPFSGRTTTFSIEDIELEGETEDDPSIIVYTGQYSENWSSETAGDCTVEGFSGGTWEVDSVLDLDADVEPDEPHPLIYELAIIADPSNPVVTCGPDEDINSSNASTPLGVGPGSVPLPDNFAKLTYEYTVDPAGSVLVLVGGTGSITNTYVFTR